MKWRGLLRAAYRTVKDNLDRLLEDVDPPHVSDRRKLEQDAERIREDWKRIVEDLERARRESMRS